MAAKQHSKDSLEHYYQQIPSDYFHPESAKMEWKWATELSVRQLERPEEVPSSIRVALHPGGTTPFHRHNFFELIYVHRGNTVNTIGTRDIRLHAGDMCLMNTNALHSLSSDDDSVVFNLLINKDLMESSVFSLIRSNDLIASFFAESIHGIYTQENYIVFPAENNEAARDLIAQMIREYSAQAPFYLTVMQAQLVWLFACMSRSFQAVHLATEGDSVGPAISSIIEYVSQNAMSATLESTAAHFHYNPSYFSRMIKRVTHQNFSDILLRFRLELAADYLLNTDLRVQEIAAKAGFGSGSYFSVAFKNRYHMSPNQFRKQKQSQE